MTVDNEIYNRPGDIWWDEQQPLNAIRTAINPARIEYFTRVLDRLGVDPRGRRVLDIGCGGGLFAEEWARMGADVIGVDPSAPSLQTARDHAAGAGLQIDYRQGTGERLPLDDSSTDIACCVDVLEHVTDLDAVIAETARGAAPRRPVCLRHHQPYRPEQVGDDQAVPRVVAATAWMPPNLHAWEQFIKPTELDELMSRHGLSAGEFVGIGPGVKPPTLDAFDAPASQGKYLPRRVRPSRELRRDQGPAGVLRRVRHAGRVTGSGEGAATTDSGCSPRGRRARSG